PRFTYSIFDDDEKIFGYEEPELRLDFCAHDLRPKLDISYKEKFKPIGETKAMDLQDMLKDFLPDDAFDKAAERTEELGSSWKPPGNLFHSYHHGGDDFEIWCASLADPAAKEILRRMQIFIPFYIEGGTCQNLDDQDWTMERWKLYLLYQVSPRENTPSYIFAGFSTSYRLWVFPTPEILSRTTTTTSTTPLPSPDQPSTTYSPLTAPSRERISQFLILPPYQNRSHGAHLYSAMYTSFATDPSVFEITVEDPNEAFDDLRDWCDLATLRTNPSFTSLSLPDSVPDDTLRPDADVPTHILLDQKLLTQLRHEAKISPRQFARLVEMQLLSSIPARHRSVARITRKHKSSDPNDRRYFFWRLIVKERVYLKNMDQLKQLEVEERVEKVEQVLEGVQEEYERVLE
ncbi:acyl-CoA N-acyltransferase, partial [Saccharata proteae CBS 121410]